MLIAIIVIVVLVGLVGFVIVGFNKLRTSDIGAQEALGGIDVQLTRRAELIPNLVETVKGYAGHERGTLEAVVQARNIAVQVGGGGPEQQAQAEGALTQALGRLFALAEAYPDLKANQNFLALQSELTSTEDKIAYARQFYNNAIQTLNASVQSFPTNLIAGPGGFATRPYFEAGGAERADVNVRF
jgi:LemA protein